MPAVNQIDDKPTSSGAVLLTAINCGDSNLKLPKKVFDFIVIPKLYENACQTCQLIQVRGPGKGAGAQPLPRSRNRSQSDLLLAVETTAATSPARLIEYHHK